MAKVKELTTGSTMQVRGLDLQLFQQLNELVPGSLVSFEDLNINSGDGLFPYCQPPTKKALSVALSTYGLPLTINSAYRSVIAQAMLYSQKQRGIIKNLVAYPGKSDHQRGSSLDIEEWTVVKNLMIKSGFVWTYGNADAMHFDCPNSEADIRQDSVKAFQILWNKANTKNQISVDGDLGQRTLDCIYNSPAEGFENVGYPRILRLTTPVQSGADVGKLQLVLREKGFAISKADQVFGNETDKAVKEFQKSINFVSDGIFGAKTLKKLYKV